MWSYRLLLRSEHRILKQRSHYTLRAFFENCVEYSKPIRGPFFLPLSSASIDVNWPQQRFYYSPQWIVLIWFSVRLVCLAFQVSLDLVLLNCLLFQLYFHPNASTARGDSRRLSCLIWCLTKYEKEEPTCNSILWPFPILISFSPVNCLCYGSVCQSPETREFYSQTVV